MSHMMRDHIVSLDESRRFYGRGHSEASAVHESMVRSALTYRLLTRVVLTSIFPCLVSVIMLVAIPALHSPLPKLASIVIILLSVGIVILTVVFTGAVIAGRRDDFVAGPVSSRSLERTLTPSEIAKYTRDLSSADEARRLGAFYFLASVAETSNADARLIVPAVESFIQSALRNRDHVDGVVRSLRRADVQSALEFLGRLPMRTRSGPGGPLRYRLSNLDLRSYDFGGLNYSGADLRGSNLSGCVLEYAIFDGADLRYATLQDASAVRASFRGALLEHANCNGGVFVEADFSEALLSSAKFDGAVLRGAKLSNAVLLYSGIADADLKDVELAQSDEKGSTLTGKDVAKIMDKQMLTSEAAVVELKGRRNKSSG